MDIDKTNEPTRESNYDIPNTPIVSPQCILIRKDMGIREMATNIAIGILQSPDMMKMADEMSNASSSDEEESTVMQNIACIAVDISRWICKYTEYGDK